MEKVENTYWIKIYLSGPIDIAKQVIRRECSWKGLCVTIESTLFIYTGGEEYGYVVGLINYPRFPLSNTEIWQRALDLANLLLDETYQHSVLIMSSDKTKWITKRE